MNFIRTEEGHIYNLDEIEINLISDAETGELFVEKMIDGYISHLDSVIKRADTIEELCDRFVFYYTKIKDDGFFDTFHREFLFLWQAKEYYENCKIATKEVKGAIYTAKGLIYVARLNDSGELELL